MRDLKKTKKPKWERGRRRPAPVHLCKGEMWGEVDSLLSKLKSTNRPNSRMCSLCLLETRILRNQRVYQGPPEMDEVTLASGKLPLKSDAFKKYISFFLIIQKIFALWSPWEIEKKLHTHTLGFWVNSFESFYTHTHSYTEHLPLPHIHSYSLVLLV